MRKKIYKLLSMNNSQTVFKRVDTCGNEFDSSTAYLYSTFNSEVNEFSCEARPNDKDKIIIGKDIDPQEYLKLMK